MQTHILLELSDLCQRDKLYTQEKRERLEQVVLVRWVGGTWRSKTSLSLTTPLKTQPQTEHGPQQKTTYSKEQVPQLSYRASLQEEATCQERDLYLEGEVQSDDKAVVKFVQSIFYALQFVSGAVCHQAVPPSESNIFSCWQQKRVEEVSEIVHQHWLSTRELSHVVEPSKVLLLCRKHTEKPWLLQLCLLSCGLLEEEHPSPSDPRAGLW